MGIRMDPPPHPPHTGRTHPPSHAPASEASIADATATALFAAACCFWYSSTALPRPCSSARTAAFAGAGMGASARAPVSARTYSSSNSSSSSSGGVFFLPLLVHALWVPSCKARPG